MSIRRELASLLLATLPLVGCTDREDGLIPVGGNEGDSVRQERFIKRLHLDLIGELPDEAETSAAVARLGEGAGPAARAAIADELLADPRFAALFVLNVEGRVFGGATALDNYADACPDIQAEEPECAACEPSEDCGGCSCPPLASLFEEREGLMAAAEDLAVGRATTGDIERRYGASQIFTYYTESPEAIANNLFVVFLGRPAEPYEVKNAAAMVLGTFEPGSPAGLLFHRPGGSYQDLVDIVFTSEVYREAAVNSVFLSYLGRNATSDERSHFVAGLDPASPDVRPVIRAVVSSGEYFSQ